MVGVGRDRRLRILQLDDDPGAGQRDEPRADARLLELAVELPDEVGRPRALGLDVLDLCAKLEDPGLQAVLLGLQLIGRLDQRGALLGRVAGARHLGRELGGHQEAQREQRQAERDLPAGDGAQAADRRHGMVSATRRRRRATRTAATTTTIARSAAGTTQPDPSGALAGASAPGVGVPTGAPPLARRGAYGPAGSAGATGTAGGPGRGHRAGGLGLRAICRRRLGVHILEPGRRERRRVDAEGVRERLVVRPPAGVRADQGDERVLAVGLDHEVDRGDALRVGEEEVVAVRELAGQAVQRDQLAGPGGVLDLASIRGAVALALVDRQTLVEPARRGVVRVPGGGVEHEMDELVGDPHGDQRIVDLVGRDETQQRPDVGVGRAGDVLVGTGPERVVELGLVGVDEEVDRPRLRDTQQLRRRRDLVLTELERLGPERLVTLVPVDAHERARRGLPVEPVVGVDDLDLRADDRSGVGAGRVDAPARDDRRVRDQVRATRGVERVGQGRGA